ncbi:MAG TPA: flagellar basal body rod protein FlgC [Phycisphaerae bacterium]|nr:flagellar basal body rod protein FlgC [Phycisphaerae bacterium]HNU46151.1 flagellar basal body rod protein FlgC [Phycisphaerae bacterium]
MFTVLDIATSGLVAQRANLEVIAGNIANREVTRQADGTSTPYRRRVALFAAGNPTAGGDAPGVHIASIIEDPSPFELRYDPQHPDALKEGPQAGYVQMPNVDYHTEMVNAMVAARAYEANVTVLDMAKAMASSTLRLLA